MTNNPKTTLFSRMIKWSKINRKFAKFQSDKVYFDPSFIVSPVQAKLVDMGPISTDKIISKNKEIQLSNLIGEYWSWFADGFFLNFYLSPKNKHYWRFPYEGKFIYTRFKQGKAKLPIMIGLERFFSNKPLFEKAITQNATVSSILQTPIFPMAMIAVGSLGVNNIKIFYQENKFYNKGEICGGFKIGSSMVLCFPNNNQFELLIKKNQKVEIGEPIIKIIT